MQIRFLLGPAGSGKTFRCLTEVRHALNASAEGLPLLLLTPKQATYQVERQFLAYPSIPGYTRLHVLSFERLAYFLFDQLGKPAPEMLDEEGRLMVLRGLLAKKRDNLKLFRASARLTGFAHQLSQVLRELQRNELTPESLNRLADQVPDVEGLSYKLHDLATLLQDYLDWLQAHNLQDADCLLEAATRALVENSKPKAQSPKDESALSRITHHASRITPHSPLQIGSLWVDGFAELSEQELSLLAALMPYCEQATFAFCLDERPSRKCSWLSNWSAVRQTFEACQKRFAVLPNAELVVEMLERHPNKSRFLNNPVLEHLEKHWATPQPFEPRRSGRESAPSSQEQDLEQNRLTSAAAEPESLPATLRVVGCIDPEAEAALAAREILRYVRNGGRFRDVTVVVRKLDVYHQVLQRVFSQYEVPFFLDRRESVSHHPLAELTRSALRTVALGWQHEDWFAALKTGLMPASDEEIDQLENEALARGWRGSTWHQPIRFRELPKSPEEEQRLRELEDQLEELRRKIVPPFHKLALALATTQNKPTGSQLAVALRALWQALQVEAHLQEWAAASVSSADSRAPASVHETVWTQMNAWLENVELAFPSEPLAVREWLPILEAGLANLSVGVIPPALDQVLIGAIDRSRNPDIKLALVLGLNETVFPAPPETTLLLTESDRLELEKHNVLRGSSSRQQIARERFYAYIACTRARERVVLTYAQRDLNGTPLNPSPFLTQIKQLFPALPFEIRPETIDWRQSEHAHELVGTMLRVRTAEIETSNLHAREDDAQEPAPSRYPASSIQHPASGPTDHAPRPPSPASRITHHASLPDGWSRLATLPPLATVLEQLRHFRNPGLEEKLAPELAARLYGPVLRTSVSRMEQFAACPFKFFVHSGLRAEERKLFELDVKEQGTFQHDVMALFHDQLHAEGKHWRDITPAEARQRVGRIAEGLQVSYREGLLQASEQTRFMARILTESLQDFAGTLVGWMQQQYRFDPVRVELPFGEDEQSPAWPLELGEGHHLELYGRIDRVDLCPRDGGGEALCVVVDYKSSQKQLDPVLVAEGLQLQLLAYLNVLRRWPSAQRFFGVSRLVPAGVFYVNLRGKYQTEQNRAEALADAETARKLAYRHTGRFDTRALPQLDARENVSTGDQFNYRLTKSGEIHKGCKEALATAQFEAMLDEVEANLKRMGQQVYAGVAEVSPYRKGTTTACDQCSYRSICRIDPWTHRFRVLRKEESRVEE